MIDAALKKKIVDQGLWDRFSYYFVKNANTESEFIPNEALPAANKWLLSNLSFARTIVSEPSIPDVITYNGGTV